MHPVPPDWALEGSIKPQEQEDINPDKKTLAITKEGATKIDHPNEFFETDKEQDINSNNGNENDMKKRKLIGVVVHDNTNNNNNDNNDNNNSDVKKSIDINEKSSQITDKLALVSSEDKSNLGVIVEENMTSDNINEINEESVEMEIVSDGDKMVGQDEQVEVEVGKEAVTAEIDR